MDEKMVEFIYETIQGGFAEPIPPNLENAFADGTECLRLYEQVYDAERRLEARLGVEAYDEDVECIICAMTEMQRHLCFKMYEYGARFGYDRDKLYAPRKEKESV